jgi:predicted transcriptional regulator
MNERRSKISILRDILHTIQKKGGKAKPTHILYGANLSHDRLKGYLDRLMQDGFVEKIIEGNNTYYIITLKGREFLLEFKKIQKFSEAFGIEF